MSAENYETGDVAAREESRPAACTGSPTCSPPARCSAASTRSSPRSTATSRAPASRSSWRCCSTASTAASRAGPTRRAISARSTTACATWSPSASRRRSSSYQWGIERIADYGKFWGRFGWLAAFFYAVAAALRLARFNARAASADKRYFEGLPSPSAAGDGRELHLARERVRSGAGLPALALAFVRITICIGALMVSKLLVLERQGAEHARAHSVDVRRADPTDLRHRVARARIAVRAVRGLCAVGAAAGSGRGARLVVRKKRTGGRRIRSPSNGFPPRRLPQSTRRRCLGASRCLGAPGNAVAAAAASPQSAAPGADDAGLGRAASAQ